MDWRDKFDEIFTYRGSEPEYWHHWKEKPGKYPLLVKEFISDLLRSQRQDLLKELRGEVEGIKVEDKYPITQPGKGIYNQALENVINLLRKYEGN
jgi:hypothetical protein